MLTPFFCNSILSHRQRAANPYRTAIIAVWDGTVGYLYANFSHFKSNEKGMLQCEYGGPVQIQRALRFITYDTAQRQPPAFLQTPLSLAIPTENIRMAI